MTLRLALIAVLLATRLLAQDQEELQSAKAAYLQSLPTSGEAARLQYVHKLVQMRSQIMDAGMDGHFTDAMRARLDGINDEIRKLPAPAESDSKAMFSLRIGKWESPRHDYIYRRNGTWSMLPIEDENTRR